MSLPALALLLALLSPAALPPPMAGGSFGSPLPLPLGDWVVRTPLVLSDVTITLRGDLVITRGGSLDLRGVTIRLDGDRDGERRILVQPGGRLVTRASPLTLRRTRLERGEGPGRFAFEVSRGGHLQLVSTVIRGAGWSEEHPGLVVEATPGGQATIADCELSENFVGVTFREAGHEVLLSRFAENTRAGIAIDRGSAVVRFAEVRDQPFGIVIGPGGALVLEGSLFTGHDTALSARRAAVDLDANLFLGNGTHVALGESDARLANNLFAASFVGVHATAGARLTLRLNDLVGNALAVRNDAAGSPVDARYNWWGSADGPGGAASGGGDPVSEGVLVAPWCDEPCRGRSDP